ncbi:hypothetical protein MCG98_06150 [Ruminococcus sp. OA3]|uniref:hypothetical protein n=1 Tax=Ruminococcus sp. OA3 TaxID=2914164 RepID=UPI001F05E3F6|nr:hypothetical protein [Ruminococcus sp. OA3]MCH1982146.1 hypothetical protein [Ruminococcus sp. OA3]
MLDQNRIRLMTNLARYEDGAGKEDLRISKYYRSDYIGIGLLKNFILTTIGYFLVWGAIIAYNMEYLLDNLHKVNMSVVILEFVIGYLLFLVLYSVVTYIRKRRRYEEARENVKNYYDGLNELARLYGQDEQRGKKKEPRGGVHS